MIGVFRKGKYCIFFSFESFFFIFSLGFYRLEIACRQRLHGWTRSTSLDKEPPFRRIRINGFGPVTVEETKEKKNKLKKKIQPKPTNEEPGNGRRRDRNFFLGGLFIYFFLSYRPKMAKTNTKKNVMDLVEEFVLFVRRADKRGRTKKERRFLLLLSSSSSSSSFAFVFFLCFFLGSDSIDRRELYRRQVADLSELITLALQ